MIAEVKVMSTLTIRNFDDGLKGTLRVLAARHGHSMEAEVRELLRAAIIRAASMIADDDIGSRIRRRFSDLDDPSFPVPPRTDMPRAAEFPE
jgi:plasmid stability protein